MTDPKWLTELYSKARAASQGEWTESNCQQWLPGSNGDEYIGAAPERYPSQKYERSFGLCLPQVEADAAHIAANSPARVLALCTLIREMIGVMEDRDIDLMEGDFWKELQRGPEVLK